MPYTYTEQGEIMEIRRPVLKEKSNIDLKAKLIGGKTRQTLDRAVRKSFER